MLVPSISTVRRTQVSMRKAIERCHGKDRMRLALCLGSNIAPVIQDMSSFSSSGSIQTRRNGAIPASDWYHSETHPQFEKSMSSTPIETQWTGGSSRSPRTRRSSMASPKNMIAEEPNHSPTAAK